MAMHIIVGGCPCGDAEIELPETIDSGLAVRCSAGHVIVFDVWSPEYRKETFKRAGLIGRGLRNGADVLVFEDDPKGPWITVPNDAAEAPCGGAWCAGCPKCQGY